MPDETRFRGRRTGDGERIADSALLHRYAEEHDQQAFAEIVRRHLDGVYSPALRRVGGDVQLAEDVAQQVFVALARKASAVARTGALTGWLFTATRHEAANVVRSERRRKAREREAHTMHDVLGLAAGDADWSRVAPVLDAAIDELGETDRGAVLARFVERQTFGEMGAALRISEDAARMRVERALEKLRVVLTRRGVVSTSAALGVALANNAVAAAPPGLVGTVTMAVVDAGVASSWAGVAQFMANTKLTVGIAGALAVATLVIVMREGASRLDAEQALATVNRAYAAQLAQMREQVHSTQTAEQATAELAKRVDGAKAAAASAALAAASAVPSPKLSPSAEGKLFLARHPDVNAALVEWANASTLTQWAPFIRAHGLTGAQLDEFLLLIRAMSMDPGPGPDGKELALDVGPTLRLSELNRRLQALLGSEGVAQVEEFRRLQPARGFADRVTEALCFSEAPFTTAQWGQLVQILDRNPATEAGAATMRFDWDGVIAHARGVLSARQLTVLDGLRTEDRWRQAVDRLSRSRRN